MNGKLIDLKSFIVDVTQLKNVLYVQIQKAFGNSVYDRINKWLNETLKLFMNQRSKDVISAWKNFVQLLLKLYKKLFLFNKKYL